MDPQAFDRLVHTFSQSASRRRALGSLLGGALAGVAGPSEAKRRHRHGGKGQRHTRAPDDANHQHKHNHRSEYVELGYAQGRD